MARYSRLAPLSGVVFLVLLFLGFLVIGGSTPDSDASAAKVVHFYTQHRGQQQAAALLVALAALFLLWFVTFVCDEVRERGGTRTATAILAGGIVAVTGFLAMAGAHFALADTTHKLGASAAQAVNAVDGDTWVGALGGTLFMTVGLAVAVLKWGLLPRWMGYLAVVLAVAMPTPVGWIAWLAMALWVAIAGVILSLRARSAVAPVAPTQPAAPVPAT